jgi:hypothetical protein
MVLLRCDCKSEPLPAAPGVDTRLHVELRRRSESHSCLAVANHLNDDLCSAVVVDNRDSTRVMVIVAFGAVEEPGVGCRARHHGEPEDTVQGLAVSGCFASHAHQPVAPRLVETPLP